MSTEGRDALLALLYALLAGLVMLAAAPSFRPPPAAPQTAAALR